MRCGDSLLLRGRRYLERRPEHPDLGVQVAEQAVGGLSPREEPRLPPCEIAEDGELLLTPHTPRVPLAASAEALELVVVRLRPEQIPGALLLGLGDEVLGGALLEQREGLASPEMQPRELEQLIVSCTLVCVQQQDVAAPHLLVVGTERPPVGRGEAEGDGFEPNLLAEFHELVELRNCLECLLDISGGRRCRILDVAGEDCLKVPSFDIVAPWYLIPADPPMKPQCRRLDRVHPVRRHVEARVRSVRLPVWGWREPACLAADV